jgi:type III pantothenate kinase
MPESHTARKLAIDVGNTRIKFAIYSDATSPQASCKAPESADGTHASPVRGSHASGQVETSAAGTFPTPIETLDVSVTDDSLDPLESWLARHDAQQARWYIGSVNRPATSRLLDWLRRRDLAQRAVLLSYEDLPLRVDLPRPDMVGIDRLLAAVAANRLRPPQRPAVIVDLGSAITVDLVSGEGIFRGGAIMPGIGMSARALHEFTDLLPRLDFEHLHEAPAVLGATTVEAMQSGLFWGAIGAARELLTRLAQEEEEPPWLVLTGGAAPSVARLMADDAHFEANLTLAGIALTAES